MMHGRGVFIGVWLSSIAHLIKQARMGIDTKEISGRALFTVVVCSSKPTAAVTRARFISRKIHKR